MSTSIINNKSQIYQKYSLASGVMGDYVLLIMSISFSGELRF